MNYTDPTGNFIFSGLLSIFGPIGTGIGYIIDSACWGAVIGAGVGAGVNAVCQGIAIATGNQSGWNWDSFWGSTINGAIGGAIGGALSGIIGLLGGGASAHPRCGGGVEQRF